jgi:hypothetical protein
LLDYFGTELRVGQLVVYPTNDGSESNRLKHGTIIGFEGIEVLIRKDSGTIVVVRYFSSKKFVVIKDNNS